MSNKAHKSHSENTPVKKINIQPGPVEVCEVTIEITEPDKVKPRRSLRHRGAFYD